MANIKFIWQALDSVSSITASAGSASGYSTENLRDRDPAKVWISGSTATGQTLLIDFGSGVTRACNNVIVENTNFATVAVNVFIQYSADNSTWTNATATTFNNTNAVQNLEFSSQNVRYWRIQFSQSGQSLSAAPQIGNLFLGTRLELTQPYNSNFETSSRFESSNFRAIDGTRYSSQVYNGIKTWKLKWTNINSTDKGYLQTLFDGIRGSFYPFYFIDADASIQLVYSTNDENPIQTKANGIFDSGELSLENFSVNT